MRKIVIGLALAMLTLPLGGCYVGQNMNTPTMQEGGTIPTPSEDPRIQIAVASVQNVTTKLCGFLPTVSTVLGIAATFSGMGDYVSIANSVASSICNAVTANNGLRSVSRSGMSAYGMVNRVPVRGQFVR